ncbi:MAG TPA: hypothetical protein VN847_21630 [Streptosporangiaceae bacterium]|nr:hypothetical protein [Streptosporangiaceae bacterium]
MSSDPLPPELVTPGLSGFAVGSYEVGVNRSWDDANLSQGGLSRVLTISSADGGGGIATSAEAWFSPFDIWNQGPKTIGWAYTSNLTTPGSIVVLVSFPLSEFDIWYDILKGGSDTVFEYSVEGPAGDVGFDVDIASLNTGAQGIRHSADVFKSRRQVQKS